MCYKSDLTNGEWNILGPFMPDKKLTRPYFLRYLFKRLEQVEQMPNGFLQKLFGPGQCILEPIFCSPRA